MSEQTGRARGRARARARGQQVPEPTRRPDVPPGIPIPAPVAQPTIPAATGRAFYRGAGHTEQRGAGDVIQAVTGAMAAIQLEGGNGNGSGRGAMRGRRFAIEEEIRTRPSHVEDKRGTSGEPIQLYANYFKLVSSPKWRIYQYHVEFAPTIESPKMRRAMLMTHLDKFGGCFTFDGMSDLKATMKFPNPETELFSKRLTDDENIRITLKFTAELPPAHPEIMRLFNTQMRRNLMHLNFIALGRHFFDPSAVATIPQHKIELWQGVLTAIRQHETSLMMVVDSVYKVLRQDTILQQMKQIFERDRHNYASLCTKQLAGSIVMTRYNNKTYRLDDFDFTKTPEDKFDYKGTPMSYIEYYKQQYKIEIQDRRQPLIICRPQERDVRVGRTDNIYLIPELCTLTGLSDDMRADFNVMRDMAQHTRIAPDKRIENLKHFINRVNSNPKVDEEMKRWGIEFSPDLVRLNARIVPGEKIVQQNQTYTFNNRSGDFSKEMRNKKMHVPAVLNDYAVIVSRRDQSKADDFLQNLLRVCPPIGMIVRNPQIIPLDDDKASSYLNAMSTLSPTIQLIICIVPNNRKDRYDAIKKRACVDVPVATQVIVARTLAKKQMLMSVATKIAIQLNCKLGGEAWAVEIPLKQKTMIVGFDTYHDSSQRGVSVGALVASMNSGFTRWFSKSSFHKQREELSDFLHVNFVAALKQFHKQNKDLPEIILFYRDGVSDGQVGYVKEHEVTQIRRAYNELADGRSPRLGFIVVNKRISTRFFADNNGRGVDNPPPGTVIDTEVTRSERYDFYLVSQSVRQGTVAPTQYNIIEDTTSLRPDHMQRITYKLTHLYYNWPGTIRVPAPCQYAHKLAFLVGQSLHRDPADELSNTLFYL